MTKVQLGSFDISEGRTDDSRLAALEARMDRLESIHREELREYRKKCLAQRVEQSLKYGFLPRERRHFLELLPANATFEEALVLAGRVQQESKETLTATEALTKA